MSGTTSGTHLRPSVRLMVYIAFIAMPAIAYVRADFRTNFMMSLALYALALGAIFAGIITLWDARREAAQRRAVRRSPSFFDYRWDPDPADRRLI